jgi:hypothetical protein
VCASSRPDRGAGAGLAESHPETHADQTVRLTRFGTLGEQDRTMLFIMLAAVAMRVAVSLRTNFSMSVKRKVRNRRRKNDDG